MPDQPAAAAAGHESPRVVWVDDDPLVRRLVQMVLQAMPVELCLCADVPQARAALQYKPAQLLVTDLMLPGESGYDLINGLASMAQPRPRVMVFSARSDLPAAADQARLGIWRILAKPAPVAMLLSSVKEAVQDLPPATAPVQQPAQALLPPAEGRRERVLRDLFGGNAPLFDQFEANFLQQLPQDIELADAAVLRQDAAGMLRLVHNLKGLLTGLGFEPEAAIAQGLEAELLAGRHEALPRGWSELREQLMQLLATQQLPEGRASA